LKKILNFLLKALVSSLFLYLVFSKISITNFVKEIRVINVKMLILAAILYLSTMLFSTIRWLYFVKTKKSFLELFELYMIGTFFNLFMPGTVGGDVIKVYYLYKEENRKTEPLVSVFMERYMGLCALMTISSIGLIFGYEYIKGTNITMLFCLTLSLFIIGTLFVVYFPYEKLYSKLERARLTIRSYFSDIKTILVTYCLSLIVQGIGVIVVYILSKGLSIELNIKYFLIFIPLITVISMLPVSLSGFGVREYSFFYLFGKFGVPQEKAVGLSLMWFFTMIITGIIGMFFYLFKKNKPNLDK
jgi:uncharacterized membrane protein YbhN (UPF0104 family)